MGKINEAWSLLKERAGVWHGVIMSGSMLFAGALDYGFNVLSGNWLQPASYTILVATLALIQILLHATNVIRNVVAYYTAELYVGEAAASGVAQFGHWAHQRSWKWGVGGVLVGLILSPIFARWLNFPNSWPLWAASLAILMLFVRPVTDGSLQGVQSFSGLAVVAVVQSALRLGAGGFFIYLGWEATGAVLGLPVATFGGYLVALWFLRPFWGKVGKEIELPKVSWGYSFSTLIGLFSFALLSNMDALAIPILFPVDVASDYGPIVTLGKINLFVPLAMAMVLFPKAVQRYKLGQDARPILALALGAALLPGLGLSTLFFLFPELIIDLVFRGAYGDLGMVMGLVGVATSLYAGVSIWLNYALSMERTIFVYALVGVLLCQIVGVMIFHGEIVQVAWVMVVCGLLGNLLGGFLTLRMNPSPAPSGSPVS